MAGAVVAPVPSSLTTGSGCHTRIVLSYIAEIASSNLADGAADCAIYTSGDLGLAATPFLLRGVAP